MNPVLPKGNATVRLEYRGFKDELPGWGVTDFKKHLVATAFEREVRCEHREDEYGIAVVGAGEDPACAKQPVKVTVALTGDDHDVERVASEANRWAHAAGIEILEVSAELSPEPRDRWEPSYGAPKKSGPEGHDVIALN